MNHDLRDATLTRFAMYDHLATAWRRLGLDPGTGASVLSVSGSEPLCAVLGFEPSEVRSTAYPEVDVTRLPFESASFDAVVSDQVLEHVEPSPRTALAETARVLRPGGVAVVTTCLLNPVHPSPQDHWRFTPSGLELLCGSVGLRTLDVGGWGNRLSVVALASGLRRVRVGRMPAKLRGALLRNDWRWPIVTWVVAERTPTED